MAEEIVTFRPLADKIIVRPDVRVLSDVIIVNNKEAENMGTVVAVGPGKRLSTTKRETMPIDVGQRVRFGTMNDDAKEEYLKFTPITHNGEKCLLMSWQDICWTEGAENGN
jgi:co-chaperonin GroES (HSP10)